MDSTQVIKLVDLAIRVLAISPDVFKRVQELMSGKTSFTDEDVNNIIITKDPEDYRV